MGSGSRARPSAAKVVAFCEFAKFGRDELCAKSEDQSSSEPARRRQNHSAPPSAAMLAATALFLGRPSSVEAADFAFCFATRLLTFQTAQPRTAFRLLSTLMARGYPPRHSSTQTRTPPPRAASCGERGRPGAREEV